MQLGQWLSQQQLDSKVNYSDRCRDDSEADREAHKVLRHVDRLIMTEGQGIGEID